MNELQLFKNEDFGEIRVLEIEGEPWFVGKDVAAVLGYSDLNKAIAMHIDEDDKLNDKSSLSLNIGLGQRGGWIINESGLYYLIFSSKLEKAKAFKKWVTSEVLPSIRKHGMYAKDELLDNPDLLIEVATKLKNEREKRIMLEKQAELDKPKILFADAVSVASTTILIGELAKLLKGNGIDIGQNRLFEKLREDGYLIKRRGSDYNAPTQMAMELGLFKVKETAITHSDGHVTISKTTKVTGKGQQYFVNKFLQGNDDVKLA